MKTPEDEAFDELAKRQGDWGGGYQAKRAMAADKLQEDLINYGTSWSQDGKRIDPMSVYKEQPAPGYCKNCKDYTIEEPLYAQPAQEPVAYVMGTHGGRFVVAPLNPAAILPVGMAFYARPQREQNFCPRCGKRTNDIHTCTPPQGDA